MASDAYLLIENVTIFPRLVRHVCHKFRYECLNIDMVAANISTQWLVMPLDSCRPLSGH